MEGILLMECSSNLHYFFYVIVFSMIKILHYQAYCEIYKFYITENYHVVIF